ncbi:MAG: hypothetical protein AAF411_17600 [Myxococcota bacterium]
MVPAIVIGCLGLASLVGLRLAWALHRRSVRRRTDELLNALNRESAGVEPSSEPAASAMSEDSSSR